MGHLSFEVGIEGAKKAEGNHSASLELGAEIYKNLLVSSSCKTDLNIVRLSGRSSRAIRRLSILKKKKLKAC